MHRYLLQRLLRSCLLMLVVILVTFSMMLAVPGGPSMLLDPNASADDIARMRYLLGLDEPIVIQYLKWLH